MENSNANSNINEAFTKAVKYSPVEEVRRMLDAGASPDTCDEHGNVALTHASRRHEIVDLLLEYGARIDLENKAGSTPLLLSMHGDRFDDALHLLNRDADPRPRKQAAFIRYVKNRASHTGLIQRFITAGVDPNLPGPEGKPPLIEIIDWTKDREIIRALLAVGADPNIADSQGKTALHYAVRRADLEIVKMLLQAGARTDIRDNKGHLPLTHALYAKKDIRQCLVEADVAVYKKGLEKPIKAPASLKLG